jgi:hypothetical protein
VTTVLPIGYVTGYVTILEAADVLQLALHAGVPEFADRDKAPSRRHRGKRDGRAMAAWSSSLQPTATPFRSHAAA